MRKKQIVSLEEARKSYPRVTQILSVIANKGYDDFRASMGKARADFVMDEKALFGIQVHALCKSYNEARIAGIPFDPVELSMTECFMTSACNAARRYIEWADKYVEKVLYSEAVVFSDKYYYRGTADVVLLMKGDKGYSIPDIKTTAVISPIVDLQTAAYEVAAEEYYGIEIQRRFAIRLTELECKIREFVNKNAFSLFLYAQQLHLNLA
jgi:hypothetical protein